MADSSRNYPSGKRTPPELRELVCGWYWSPGVAVPVAVFQPSPDRTLASWLDSPLNVTGTDSTHRHRMDGEHQPTDLAVGGSNPSRRAASQQVRGFVSQASRLGSCAGA
jgi:hypothetical protein